MGDSGRLAINNANRDAFSTYRRLVLSNNKTSSATIAKRLAEIKVRYNRMLMISRTISHLLKTCSMKARADKSPWRLEREQFS